MRSRKAIRLNLRSPKTTGHTMRIAGAGFAGLASTIALQQRGWSGRVHEKVGDAARLRRWHLCLVGRAVPTMTPCAVRTIRPRTNRGPRRAAQSITDLSPALGVGPPLCLALGSPRRPALDDHGPARTTISRTGVHRLWPAAAVLAEAVGLCAGLVLRHMHQGRGDVDLLMHVLRQAFGRKQRIFQRR